MDKEEFLQHAMKLLQTFIDEDGSSLRASDYLQSQGVPADEIHSVLHTISNMAKGYV